MENKERTVIHLQMGEQHFYFGSIRALCNQFSHEEIGISYGSIRNYGLSEIRPYVNSKCCIRKGTLKSIEGNRGKYNRNVDNV